jgi:hypothetical protein
MASILNINGIDVKNPDSFEWQLSDLSSVSSGEDQSGYTHKDIVRRKRHINLKWGILKFSEAHAIIAACTSDANFPCTFPDLLAGERITRTMYVGDRSSPLFIYNEAKSRLLVSEVSFDLIEVGGDQP